MPTYDVIHLDPQRGWLRLAAELERDAAIVLAREEARRRNICRMFLAGSVPRGECVLIVPADQRPLAA